MLRLSDTLLRNYGPGKRRLAARRSAYRSAPTNGSSVSSVKPTHDQGAYELQAIPSGAVGQQTIVRTARVSWLTEPPRGHARVSVGFRAFTALRLSESAAGEEPGVTDPSELFAAAHASAFAVILARTLDSNQTPAHELVIAAACEYAGAWYEVKAIEFSVQGRIPNIDLRQFEEATYTAVERYRQSFAVDPTRAVAVHVALF
jgi:organic hydroperoxide reductase OsmC/OhrA